MKRGRGPEGLVAWAVVAGLLAACGGDEGGGGSPASGAGAGSSTFDPSTGSGDGSTGSGVIDEDAACASAVAEGTPIPVQMLIMFDKSGSMLEDQKWAGAKAALIAFFQDDDSAGLKVALRFFPDDEPAAGCNENACSVEACSKPLVDVGELLVQPASSDPHQKALVEAVESRSPGGQTPMYAALAGAEAWATAHAAPEGEGKTVVVLVTDGEPNGCNEDVGAIAALAGDAHAGAGILTYAIGMAGANQAQLDQIALAGGTTAAFVIGNGSVHKDLVAAFDEIGTTELGCVFAVPQADDVGEDVDPTKVNVNHVPGGGSPVTLTQVGGESSCGAAGGWYYDDPADPATISLCPSTCAKVQDDPGAQIRIVLGCATVVK